MKKISQTIVKTCIVILALHLITTSFVYAALHGSYTINPSAAASSTNYKTFGSAVSDLSSGTRADGGTANGPGVSAAVTFTVSSATYSEQVVIPTTAGTITGASSTNTITFNGGSGNDANVILTSAGSGSNYATLVYHACKYVTFENITIDNTASTDAYGVVFYNDGTGTLRTLHNKLENCIVKMESVSATSVVGVAGTSSLTSLDPDGYVNIAYDTVEDCSIHNGYYSFYLAEDSEFVIDNDSLLNAYEVGINYNASNTLKITNNYIQPSSTATESISINNSTESLSSTTDYSEISNNIIYFITGYGIFLGGSGTSSYPTMIFNNYIGGGISAGDKVSACVSTTISATDYVDFWFNTLSLNRSGKTTSSACLEFTGSSNNWSIENNIFNYAGVSTTKGEGIYIPSSDISSSTIDYNLFYNSATTSLEATINGTAYTSSTVIGGGGFNSHSQVNNPYFTDTSASAPNLNILYQNPRGTQISGITTDIHGNTRANPPCIGGDEILLNANAGSSTTICSNAGSIRIGANPTVSGDYPPFRVSWTSSPSGFSSDSIDPIVDPTVTTTYSLTVIDTIGDTATSTIVVTPTAIDDSFTYRKDTVCVSSNDTLTAGLSGAIAYNWTVPCGLGATEIDGGKSIILTSDTAGLFNICLTVENSTCLSNVYCEAIYFESCGPSPELLQEKIPSTSSYSSIEVYPTILNEQTQLNVIIPTGIATGVINIYNLMGERVAEYNLEQGKSQFTLSSEFSTGLYIYHVILNDNISAEGKLIWMQ